MTNLNTIAQGVGQAISQTPSGGGMRYAPINNGLVHSDATPFGNMLQSMVHETSALDVKAQQAVTGLLDGSGVELHEAMMATQKADLAFSLGLEMRNKAVAAYQQMMTMQF